MSVAEVTAGPPCAALSPSSLTIARFALQKHKNDKKRKLITGKFIPLGHN